MGPQVLLGLKFQDQNVTVLEALVPPEAGIQVLIYICFSLFIIFAVGTSKLMM